MNSKMSSDKIDKWWNHRYHKHLHKRIIRGPLTKSMKNFNKGTLFEGGHPWYGKINKIGERRAYADMAQTDNPTAIQRATYEYYRKKREKRYNKWKSKKSLNSYGWNRWKNWRKRNRNKKKLDFNEKPPKLPTIKNNEPKRSNRRRMKPAINKGYGLSAYNLFEGGANLAGDIAEGIASAALPNRWLAGFKTGTAVLKGLSRLPKMFKYENDKIDYAKTWDIDRPREEYDTYVGPDDYTPKTIRVPKGGLTTVFKYEKNNQLNKDFNELMPDALKEGLYKFHHGNATIDFTPKYVQSWFRPRWTMLGDKIEKGNIEDFNKAIKPWAKKNLGWTDLNGVNYKNPEGNPLEEENLWKYGGNEEQNWDKRYENV